MKVNDGVGGWEIVAPFCDKGLPITEMRVRWWLLSVGDLFGRASYKKDGDFACFV